MRSFCEECHNMVEYTVTDVNSTKNIKGKNISYIEKVAFCKECDREIFVSKLRDYNLKQIDIAYRESEGLITIDQIQFILDKYNIGKRPLSELLGWGEGTLTRYLDGAIPTRQYSDKLFQILNDPNEMDEILEKNRDVLKQISYNKCKEAISNSKYSGKVLICPNNKIDRVAKYILNITADITALALQKLLYFSQGFNRAFNGAFLFDDECEAWIHGPVYKEIYQKYKEYGYNPITDESTDEEGLFISQSQKEVLNSVITNFGCYSGKILEKMTHSEIPWLSARRDLPDSSASNELITKDTVERYFTDIKQKYNMLNVSDIRDYSRDLFDKVSR